MRSLVVALFVLAATVATAVSAPPTPTVTRHVLANGMTVLVREDPVVGVVATALHVRAGALFETDETAGITNFLQRVMVRGTARRSAQALVEAAQELGGSIDGSGDFETAEVQGTALARHWEPLLELLADVVLTPTLPADEIERERRLITSQLQLRGETPYSGAWDALMRDLYGPHPYSRPVLGRAESVARITRATLVEHHRLVYRPDRMVLAVSGNVPTARVLAFAGRRFGTLAPPAAAAPSPISEAAARGERRTVERPAEQAQIFVGYLAPSLSAPDYAAVRVLSAVAGGGMSGRLFQELRERRGLAYAVGTLTLYRTGPGVFATYLGTTPASAEAALEGVLAEIDRLRREPPTEREVERAKAYLLGNLAMDRRTNARHAWYLGYFEAVGVGWNFPERLARAIEAVTAADVARAAERYLGVPTVAVLRPGGSR